MSFRQRLFAAFLLAVLVPLALLAWGVRRQMDARLSAEEDERLAGLVGSIGEELAARRDEVTAALRGIGRELEASTRFRLAIAGAETERRWLLDEAGSAMRARGLDLLLLVDSGGRILSSGHFRNEYGRQVPGLRERLAAARDSAALVRAPTPEGSVLALARQEPFRAAGREFAVIGGVAVDSAFVARLARDPGLGVTLAPPGATTGPPLPGDVVAELAIPYVEAGSPAAAEPARFVVRRTGSALAELRRDVTRWLLAAAAVTLVLALGLSAWLASRVSRPLRELAARTEAIDLDALDQDFSTDRTDEIGTLSRLLGAMTGRLRAGTVRLRDAERRAVVGDMSRQVTHDIKNGLAPIRHVLRHLSEVSDREPEKLPGVFAERRGTLESSVEYLETLARNYGKLSPEPARAAADLNALVRDVMGSVPPRGAELRADLDESLPPLAADPLALRRILENLVGNAVDSLGGGGGTVTVSTRSAGGGRILLEIADTGSGMTREQLDRAFDDFHTTKPGGTGLGLSVVRRLVADIGGSLRVATEPGAGTRFTIELGGAA